jgi:hypothetical protein
MYIVLYVITSKPTSIEASVRAILLFFMVFILSRVGWVPCYHGMAHPQVADGGDSL